jgi:hypothetical protein
LGERERGCDSGAGADTLLNGILAFCGFYQEVYRGGGRNSPSFVISGGRTCAREGWKKPKA